MVVAYDGTNYCGWQKQPNGICIEEVLNRELSKLLNEPIEVIGASRTDSVFMQEATLQCLTLMRVCQLIRYVSRLISVCQRIS